MLESAMSGIRGLGAPLASEQPALIVGKVYRLRFPGIAARVIATPSGLGSPNYPYLVESLLLRSRWYVNEFGEPDNIHSPRMITPARRNTLAIWATTL